jgi:adenosylcobalamin-dependent ribonucleoside-triphosphate reductase
MPQMRYQLGLNFLSQYKDFPEEMNPLGQFVYLRTYSRFIEEEGRRETWKETCKRTVEYSMGLAIEHYQSNNIPMPTSEIQEEAQMLFDNMFHLRQFLSGRTLWVGGTVASDKFPLGNFNCSFLNIEKWEDLGELFYLLLVGTGVGFKITKRMASNLPRIRTNIQLIHSEYKPVQKHERYENTVIRDMGNGYTKIYVGDSKEGWREALDWYFALLTKDEYEYVHTIKISYNSVRPKGERLKTFGGTASGHQTLQEMFEGFHKILRNEIDPTLKPIENGRVRPIHIVDMANLVGYNTVVGGVRRTAEIALFDADDWECILAKYAINGLWTPEHIEQHIEVGKKLEAIGQKPVWWDDLGEIGEGRFQLDHRRMSNNSIAFTEQPSREMLNLVFSMMRMEGEPGFVNLKQLASRRFYQLGMDNPTEAMYNQMMDSIGMNPCAEIILNSKGVCNLTTVNVLNFVKDGKLDYQSLIKAQALSARAGMRMTLVELEMPEWSQVQKRDRLLGTSLTGWKDAMGALNYSSQEESGLLRDLFYTARKEADRYAKQLRITTSLLVTTIKPEGTLSQVAGGVSSGLHASHSPYFIRRIRINSEDALAKAVKDLGWVIHAEVGTKGDTEEERLANARTLVIDFPVKSDAKITKNDLTVRSQFDTYFKFQKHYTEHNSSNTITVKPNEWSEAEDIVWDNWDAFSAVSFLSHDGGTYQLAP